MTKSQDKYVETYKGYKIYRITSGERRSLYYAERGDKVIGIIGSRKHIRYFLRVTDTKKVSSLLSMLGEKKR